MRRLLHRPSRKKDDGEAANKHQSRRDLHYASTSQQHTTAPLPERPKPQATVATSRSQSLTGDKSSFLSSSPAPSSAEGRSQPSLTTSSGRAASTTAPQNLQHGRRQDGTASGGTAAKKDYWQFAVEKLQEKDSSVADQIVGVQEAATAAGNADFALQLLHMTEQGQQALEAKTWTIITGSRVLVLRDHFDRLVKAVTLFKDVGNATGSTDPLHTGLPLAGFCVLMQVWPATSCARHFGDTDTEVDGDRRLGPIRGDGGRCGRDCDDYGTISTDRSTVPVPTRDGIKARFRAASG